MSDLVVNPEDRFSCDAAHTIDQIRRVFDDNSGTAEEIRCVFDDN